MQGSLNKCVCVVVCVFETNFELIICCKKYDKKTYFVCHTKCFQCELPIQFEIDCGFSLRHL